MNSSTKKNRILTFLVLSTGCALMLFGISVILGWILDNNLLKGGFRGITVKTNAGICYFLCGLALLLQGSKQIGPKRLTLARLAGFCVMAIATLTLAQHLFKVDFGIDQLLFTETAGEAATSSPNRMGPPGSFCLTLAGFALIIVRSERMRLKNLATSIGLFIGGIALLSALGYLFDAEQLYSIAGFTGIAMPTTIALMCLSAGMIGACRSSSFLELLCAPEAGGVLARRLLPAALVLPPLLSYLRTLGQDAGLYDSGFGRALFGVGMILILSRLIWSSARALQKTDVERLQLLARERSARNQAERASQLKDEFLATISHELRTPLNAILGWSQLLKRRGQVSPESAAGIDVIERNARLQAQLIRDLLDMSRIISGKLWLNLKRIDLREVVNNSLSAAHLVAKEKGVSLSSNLSNPDLPMLTVEGDADRLQQVFGNLLSNAVKFTPTGGQVQINVIHTAEQATIEIQDNGEGIEPEFLPHIFARFRQADSSTTRRHGGLGLGLSIVRELVQLHHGTVTAESAGKDRGSTFIVTLPLASSSKNALTSSVTNQQAAISSNLNGLKVLIVEDEADARLLISAILTQYGAQVVAAKSAAEALELLKDKRPQLLISDIGMPEHDGYELIRRVRALSGSFDAKNLPAIALTAFVREEDRQRALIAGYQAHLPKPVNADNLISTIEGLLLLKAA